MLSGEEEMTAFELLFTESSKPPQSSSLRCSHTCSADTNHWRPLFYYFRSNRISNSSKFNGKVHDTLIDSSAYQVSGKSFTSARAAAFFLQACELRAL